MIKNSYNEIVDVFIVYARPEKKMNQSFSNLLTGGWFIQTIGDAAEILKMKVACNWDILQELIVYSVTKEVLFVNFLDFDKRGIIMNNISYDIAKPDDVNPMYIATFDLAVVVGDELLL